MWTSDWQVSRAADLIPSQPLVRQVLNEPGRRLEDSPRQLMESRFGQDFSSVRVHTGPLAEASARSVHAAAYTVGGDIVFGPGRYAPQGAGGQRLLAHELAHVVQQGGVDARSRFDGRIATGDAAGERLADEAASAAMRGDQTPAGSAAQPGVMQRQEEAGGEDAEALGIGQGPAQPEPLGGDRDSSACSADHDTLPVSDRPFRAETGNGSLPIFCVTKRRLQLTIRGDWREQITNPDDRPGEQRSRRPDRPKFFLSLGAWYTGGSHLTTGDITPGTERTITFDDVETGRQGLGYRVHITCIDPQRNRVLHGRYSVSQS